jgi:dipeptidyl aminopeptidase/acylaminoacyl peptidase
MVTALVVAFFQTDKIPLDVLFSEPQQTAAQISPDREHVSFLAPSDGHTTVWMEPVGTRDAQPLFKASADIGNYRWAPDGKTVLFFQDHEGDEVFHLMSADVVSGMVRDLTPIVGVTAQNLMIDANHPNEVLVGMNKRDRGVFDMYRLNLMSGEAMLDTENPGDVLSWNVDSKFQIRACSAIDLKDASTYVRVRNDAKSPWRELFHATFDKSLQTAQYQGGSSVVGFCNKDQDLLVVDALHSDTGQLEDWDVATSKFVRKVYGDSGADIADLDNPDGTTGFRVLTNQQTGDPIAVGVDPGVTIWHALDHAYAGDFARFDKFQPCDLTIASRSNDDMLWVVHVSSSVLPGRYYLLDRKKRKLEMLFDEYPQFEPYNFGAELVTSYKARDGMRIPVYLTLPPGSAVKPPLVVLPHGGPWVRDTYGFGAWAQFLATRGYAVLQPEYRGSTGFGTSFLNASTGEWAGKMSDDVTDGVQWAIKSGFADPKRVAIFGASYGGYETLTSLWQNPDLYRCAVEMSGPVDVGTLIAQFKNTWAPIRARWIARIGGDPSTDKALNEKISPLYHVDAIKAPVLVMHGKHDPRVQQTQAEAIVKALKAKGLAVEYVLYPDEGHGISNPKNQIDFFRRTEKFLEANLGGK